MNRELLETPFPPEQVRQRQGNFGNTLDYVEAHAVIQRLNDALDSAWSFEILEHHVMKEINEVLVLGKLSTNGISKCQFGSSSITRTKQGGEVISLADDLKAAATDSLKKCASMLGVGLHLYGGKHNGDNDQERSRKNVTPIRRDQDTPNRISAKQHQYIISMAQTQGRTIRELNDYCLKVFGTGFDFISRKDASSLIEVLRSGQPPAFSSTNAAI